MDNGNFLYLQALLVRFAFLVKFQFNSWNFRDSLSLKFSETYMRLTPTRLILQDPRKTGWRVTPNFLSEGPDQSSFKLDFLNSYHLYHLPLEAGWSLFKIVIWPLMLPINSSLLLGNTLILVPSWPLQYSVPFFCFSPNFWMPLFIVNWIEGMYLVRR